eukprot:804113_1
MRSHALRRGNRVDLTIASNSGFAGSSNQLSINAGWQGTSQLSDWACTEIIIINQKIPLDDIICIENYLLEKYSTNAPTSSPTSAPSSAPTFTSDNPTATPSDAPTVPSVPPTQAPTAPLQVCVDPAMIEAWYDGDSIDIASNTWTDKSGNNNHGSIGVSTGIGLFEGTEETHELFTDWNQTVVYGATTTQITFAPTLHASDHTVFYHCKHRDSGTIGRILQATLENAVFGFHNGGSGIAYYPSNYISGNFDHFGTAWVLSVQQRDLYRGNRVDLTIASNSGFAGSSNQLSINAGWQGTSQLSDWACTEIIIINQKLALNEIQCIENYLFERYTTPAPTSAPTAPTSSPTRHMSSQSFKYEFGFVTAPSQANSKSPDTHVVTLYW